MYAIVHCSGPTGMSRPIIYTKRGVYLTVRMTRLSPEHRTWASLYLPTCTYHGMT